MPSWVKCLKAVYIIVIFTGMHGAFDGACKLPLELRQLC